MVEDVFALAVILQISRHSPQHFAVRPFEPHILAEPARLRGGRGAAAFFECGEKGVADEGIVGQGATPRRAAKRVPFGPRRCRPAMARRAGRIRPPVMLYRVRSLPCPTRYGSLCAMQDGAAQ